MFPTKLDQIQNENIQHMKVQEPWWFQHLQTQIFSLEKCQQIKILGLKGAKKQNKKRKTIWSGSVQTYQTWNNYYNVLGISTCYCLECQIMTEVEESI